MSTLWAIFCYSVASTVQLSKPLKALALPVLVVGPLLIVLFANILEVNLIFPVRLITGSSALVIYGLVPALVLLGASGLFYRIYVNVRSERLYWRRQPFVLVAKSLGKPVEHSLFRLVMTRGVGESWVQCLPWLFGELVVVEAMFNAPGLGFYIWDLAKTRNFLEIAYATSLLLVLYGFACLITYLSNFWLGRKLDSYV